MELVIGLAEGEIDPWLLAHAVVHWTCRRRDRSTVTGPCSWSLDLQTERYIAGYWPMQLAIGSITRLGHDNNIGRRERNEKSAAATTGHLKRKI